jgi:hypothetical protein
MYIDLISRDQFRLRTYLELEGVQTLNHGKLGIQGLGVEQLLKRELDNWTKLNELQTYLLIGQVAYLCHLQLHLLGC